MIEVIVFNNNKEQNNSFEATANGGEMTGYGKNEKEAKERLKELVEDRIKELNDLIKEL